MEALNLARPHWEALTSDTQLAFRLLAEQDFIQSFYLAGGTGLALYFGHRFSIDLDFFSENPNSVDYDQRLTIRRSLYDPSLSFTHDKDGTFVATWRGVGVSFFRLDEYPIILPLSTIENVRLASIQEIGAMKLAAIIGRGNRKDYIDLYFILQQFPLDDIFRIAAKKYSRVRTFAISATRALAYFEDAESQPMPQMIDTTPWPKIKRFLEKQATQAGRQHLEDLWD